MIGIDLVDLKQAKKDCNWQRKGYLNKIFTSDEQELIYNYEDPNLMVWLLWSMKEAAYKVWSTTTGQRIYAPTSLLCGGMVHSHIISAVVTDSDDQYFTQSNLTEDYIYTIATREPSQLTNVSVKLSNSAKEYRHPAPIQSRSHHGRYLATAWL